MCDVWHVEALLAECLCNSSIDQQQQLVGLHHEICIKLDGTVADALLSRSLQARAVELQQLDLFLAAHQRQQAAANRMSDVPTILVLVLRAACCLSWDT